MGSLPLHPAVVHLPLGLSVILPFLAVGIFLAIRRSLLPTRAWVLVLGLLAVVTVSAFVGTRTGEEVEEDAQDRVSEELIREHGEAAELFMIAAGVVTALSALGLAQGALGQWAGILTVAGTLLVAGLGLRAGHKGGELVYVHGAVAVPADSRRRNRPIR